MPGASVSRRLPRRHWCRRVASAVPAAFVPFLPDPGAGSTNRPVHAIAARGGRHWTARGGGDAPDGGLRQQFGGWDCRAPAASDGFTVLSSGPLDHPRLHERGLVERTQRGRLPARDAWVMGCTPKIVPGVTASIEVVTAQGRADGVLSHDGLSATRADAANLATALRVPVYADDYGRVVPFVRLQWPVFRRDARRRGGSPLARRRLVTAVSTPAQGRCITRVHASERTHLSRLASVAADALSVARTA